MQTFNPQVLKYLQPEQIPKHLSKLHSGMVITENTYESVVPGTVHDMEWNFYDEPHRQYVHNTYDNLYKVMTGKYFSVNIVRWKKLPIFFQVANAKIDDGMMYQSMTILGIICVHQIATFTPKDKHTIILNVKWWTASHWIFKWLHRPFNKMLLKLQKKQDREDNEEIRQRRVDLRCAGFSFTTDNPDFINSNTLSNNVILPDFISPTSLSIEAYSPNQIHSIKLGPLELMLKKIEEGVQIWPGICPHEGALLDSKHICEGVAHCPWHGRTFNKRILNKNNPLWLFLNVKVDLSGTELIISKREKEQNNINIKERVEEHLA